MATIGVLKYTLPDGLKKNKNLLSKNFKQNLDSISCEKGKNQNIVINTNRQKKIVNLTNVESLGMFGADVVVMRTKQKLTPLKEPHHNIENQSTDSIKQPSAKKQKVTHISNVTVTTMPLSNIINTTNVTEKLPINIHTNITSNNSLDFNALTSNTITYTCNSSLNFIKQETSSTDELSANTISYKISPQEDKLIESTKICGTNTKTNQPIITGGRKLTPLPQAVARRNARERNRVKQVNNGFAALRQRIPDDVAEAFEAAGGRGSNKKLSKVETLRMAVEYIRSLERILGFEYATHIPSSTESDGMLSPLPSDDDILFNSTCDVGSDLSDRSPQSLMPHAINLKNENSVITSENSNTPPPDNTNSTRYRLASSFKDINTTYYKQNENTVYYTDSLPDITTVHGQDYLRIPGTNAYQLIPTEILENEENFHPTSINVFNQKAILNVKSNFVNIHELINTANIQQNQIHQLPLPSMPFTSSMLDQQKILQVSEFSTSNCEEHNHITESMSPLTVNCINDNTPALIPSPDHFCNQSSNLSGSSYTNNSTSSHNNNFSALIIDQLPEGQIQNEKNGSRMHHLHNQDHRKSTQHSHQLLKVKIEPQLQQISHRLLPQKFVQNHDFSNHSTTEQNTNNSHIYDTLSSVINQNTCGNSSGNCKNKLMKTQIIKIERSPILDAEGLTEEKMMEAIEWWETNTPKSDQC